MITYIVVDSEAEACPWDSRKIHDSDLPVANEDSNSREVPLSELTQVVDNALVVDWIGESDGEWCPVGNDEASVIILFTCSTNK